jgi:hypothetical protein
VATATSDEYQVGLIDWLGTSERNARDLLDAEPEATGAVGDAAGILREYLTDGEKLADECKAYCREAGISGRTLDRAKKALGVTGGCPARC